MVSASTWADISTSPVSNASQPFNQGKFAISSIVPDAHDASGQTVYVTIAGFSGNGISASLVYQSKDAGAHWANMNSNLPWAPANSLAIDPQDAETVYIALDTGVYVTQHISSCSNPLINCWSVLGTGLPNAPVTQLRIEGASPMLRAATYGRGIWQIPLPGTQSKITMAEAVTCNGHVSRPACANDISSENSRCYKYRNGGVGNIANNGVGRFTQTNTCPTSVPAQGSRAMCT